MLDDTRSVLLKHAVTFGRNPAFKPSAHLARNWPLASLAVAGLVALSMLYVDRPMARLMAEFGLFQEGATRDAAGLPLMIVVGVIAALVGLRYLFVRKPMPKYVEAGLIAGWALMASVCLIQLLLKPVIGRGPPADFLVTGRYGFHPFDWPGWWSDVFPSGHSAQAAAILAVLWVYYPRWRWLYVAGMVVLALALMLGVWHFFSDIVAGAYVGAAMAALSLWLWQVLKPSALPAARRD